MSFDWEQFFQQRGISYVTSGPNVARNQIAIQCPWCGIDDHSQHLSINLEGKGFRCWRNPHQHSGKNPAKLIQSLLSCSWEQANQIAGNDKALPDNFLSKIKSAFADRLEIQKSVKLKLPSEFKKFSLLPSAKPYIAYLMKRNLSDEDIQRATDWGIYYASQGNYKGRIVFTITQESELVGWTGRTIYPNEEVRYKTLTHDREKAAERGEVPAPNPISHYLLFYDRLVKTSANTIVLCEGPFDALKVNLLGQSMGVCSTCCFTSSYSAQQINLLHGILPKFEHRYLLLDQNTFSKSQRIRSDLAALDVIVKRLPQNVKDPGEFTTAKQLGEVFGN